MAVLLKATAAQQQTSYNSSERVHIVQQGETLSDIAQAYGTTIKKLIQINTLKNPNILKLGQEIVIPD